MTPAPGDDVSVERFPPTSGRVSGVLVIVLAGVVLVVTVLDPSAGMPLPVVAAAVLAAVLAWAVMLRPALWVSDGHLVMRNAFETVTVPLAAIERTAVGRVTVVRAGPRKLVSTVVHRSLRKVVLGSSPGDEPGLGEAHLADHVEQRISQLAEEARRQQGVALFSDEQEALADGVRREPAWLPIGLSALVAVGLVVTLLL